MREETKNFLAAMKHFPGWGYGVAISHEEFDRMAGLHCPADAQRDATNAFNLQRVAVLSEVRDELLREHKMLLINVRTEGYKVIHPSEQTDHALYAGAKDLKRAFTRMDERLTHVNRPMLTPEERARNDIARAKIAALQTLANRKVLLGALPKKKIH